MNLPLVDAHARGPVGVLLVDGDLVGERVRLARRYRRDVVLVRVDAGHDLHGGRQERLLHGLADLGSFCEGKGSFRSAFSFHSLSSFSLSFCFVAGVKGRHTAIRLGLCDRHLDGPALPAHLLVAAAVGRAHVPRLAALLLEELDLDVAAAAAGHAAARQRVVLRVRALGVELARQLRRPLLDHGVQLHVVDEGERDVEDLARARLEGWEEPVEEYRVQDSYKLQIC